MTHRLDVACSRELAARWRALAERRLDHLTELFDSGRWRRYYTEQSLIDDIKHAKAAIQTWKALADGQTGPVSLAPMTLAPASISPAETMVAAPPVVVAPPMVAAPQVVAAPPVVETPPVVASPPVVVSAPMVAAPEMVVAPPAEPERLPEPIELYTLDEHGFDHRPIRLSRPLDALLARSEIIVEPEIALGEPELEPDDLLAPDEVVEHDVAPELTNAPLRIDMSALEQALSIGIDTDVAYDEPVLDLDAIERRYPALAVAY